MQDFLDKKTILSFLIGFFLGIVVFGTIFYTIRYVQEKKEEEYDQLMTQQYNDFISSTYNLSEIVNKGVVDWTAATVNIERGDVAQIKVDGLMLTLIMRDNTEYITKQPKIDSYKEFVAKSQNQSIIVK